MKTVTILFKLKSLFFTAIMVLIMILSGTTVFGQKYGDPLNVELDWEIRNDSLFATVYANKDLLTIYSVERTDGVEVRKAFSGFDPNGTYVISVADEQNLFFETTGGISAVHISLHKGTGFILENGRIFALLDKYKFRPDAEVKTPELYKNTVAWKWDESPLSSFEFNIME